MSGYAYTTDSLDALEAAVETLRGIPPTTPDARFYEAIQAIKRATAELEVAYLAEHREHVQGTWRPMSEWAQGTP